MIKGIIKPITKETRIPVKVFCDICGKEIPTFNAGETACVSVPRFRTETIMEITTGHYDWGNDSCDSVECLICCDAQCAQQKVTELYSLWEKHKKDGITNYLEIHPRVIYVHPELLTDEENDKLVPIYEI